MKKKIIIAASALVLFILLIVTVRKIDVGTFPGTGTTVGAYSLNSWFHGLTGVQDGWYKFTQILGIVSIAVGSVFAVIGLVQLIKRKNFFRIDRQILFLGGLFVLLGILYLVFELIPVNYRPVLMPGEVYAPEPSFPSSHTMLVFVIMSGVAVMLNYYVKNKRLRVSLQALCALFILVMTVGRLLSGVHWLTDILGGILISLSLVFTFSALLEKFCPLPEENGGRS